MNLPKGEVHCLKDGLMKDFSEVLPWESINELKWIESLYTCSLTEMET
mgnify:CR=1 FL=1